MGRVGHVATDAPYPEPGWTWIRASTFQWNIHHYRCRGCHPLHNVAIMTRIENFCGEGEFFIIIITQHICTVKRYRQALTVESPNARKRTRAKALLCRNVENIADSGSGRHAGGVWKRENV